jgi:hypothetical protein
VALRERGYHTLCCALHHAAVEAKPAIARPTGAISHPEAILRTSDPELQRLIDEAEKKYKQWQAADLLELSMQRSYQLLKDSKGKLPSKSISAMANVCNFPEHFISFG